MVNKSKKDPFDTSSEEISAKDDNEISDIEK